MSMSPLLDPNPPLQAAMGPSSWRQSGCYGLYLPVAFLALAFIPVLQILPTLAE